MNIPTASQLKQGLEIAEKIAALEAEMAALFGGQPVASPAATIPVAPAPAKTGKRSLSPQALANIRAAQKKRWAKVETAKGGAKPAAASPAAKPEKKGAITPAGRARLAAAMKARWAAAKKRGGPAPTARKS
jgi:hypothetical protein